MHGYRYNINNNTENTSYECYGKSYLLCGYESIPTRTGSSSPIQPIGDLIRNIYGVQQN